MRGLSQSDLATALKVEQSSISLIENKRANPMLRVIEQIADALRVSTGEFRSMH